MAKFPLCPARAQLDAGIQSTWDSSLASGIQPQGCTDVVSGMDGYAFFNTGFTVNAHLFNTE